MKTVILMCGVPGVGKSTLAKQMRDNYIEQGISAGYISRDEVRFSIVKEDEEYFSHENEVYRIFIDKSKESIQSNDVTIIDATHISIGSRTKTLRALGSSLKGCRVIAHVVDASYDTIIQQNQNRYGTRAYVPVDVIKGMYVGCTVPTEEEGFDEICITKH